MRTEKSLSTYIRERYLWLHCNSASCGTACLWRIEMQACKPRGLDNKFIALSEDAASPIIGFWALLFSNNSIQLNGYVHCPQCRTSEEKSDAAPAPRMPQLPGCHAVISQCMQGYGPQASPQSVL